MRYLVELSLATGKKLYVSSMETFHMFFAEMGCIPEQKDYSYVEKYYGAYSRLMVEKFCSCTSLEEAVRKLDQDVREDLAFLLRKEQRLPPTTTISDAQLWEQREWFAQLQKKSISYISNQYIPRWLRALENDEVYPSILKQHQALLWGPSEGPITMVLSPLGEKRWKEAIEQGTDFQPFRDGAHLVPYMTPEQNKDRQAILALQPSETESSSNSL